MKSNSLGEIVEVGRFRFRAHLDISPSLREVRFEARPGGEYQIRPEDYLKAIHLLKDNPNFQLKTARDIQNGLSWLKYTEVRTRPRWIDVEDPDSWSYLSPVARRWRRCLASGLRILARPGWALTHHRRGRPEFFFLEDGVQFEDCKMPGDRAIYRAYEGVLGNLPIPSWRNDNLLFALWPGYVIPKKHEHFLTHTLSASSVPLSGEEGEAIWCWYTEDADALKNTFQGLRLRLVDWDPGDNWLHIASLIMRRAYTTYLRRRNGAQELSMIIRQRAWNKIEDEQLCVTIKKLSFDEWNGVKAATDLLVFTQSQLCVELDWQEYGKHLEGWLIESSTLFYGPHELDSRYYRLVVPQFDTTLGWQTKREPAWEDDRQPKLNIYNWRAVPIVGRLKSAPVGKAPEAAAASRAFRDAALRSLLGLPGIEWELAQQLNVGAFMLDLDGAHWHGVNDLCRYFASYGRLVARNAAECDGYGLIMEDAIGKRFAVETHSLQPRDLEILENGEWYYFIAISSALRHQTWRQLKRDVPVFELKLRGLFRIARQEEVLKFSLLAIVKYHFGIRVEDIFHFFEGNWKKDSLDRLLKVLIAENEILEYRGKMYYRYTMLARAQMVAYLADGIAPSSHALDLLRPLIHPLNMRSIKLAQNNMPIPDGRQVRIRIIGIKSEMDDAILRKEVCSELLQKGIVRLAARGKQAQRATKLVGDLTGDLPNIKVCRCDGTYKFEDGETVKKVEYILNDPVRQLQIRVSGED
jgi:hypothetical protein